MTSAVLDSSTVLSASVLHYTLLAVLTVHHMCQPLLYYSFVRVISTCCASIQIGADHPIYATAGCIMLQYSGNTLFCSKVLTTPLRGSAMAVLLHIFLLNILYYNTAFTVLYFALYFQCHFAALFAALAMLTITYSECCANAFCCHQSSPISVIEAIDLFLTVVYLWAAHA